MTDISAGVAIDDDEGGALLSLLLGGKFDKIRRDPSIGNLTNWSPGILRRLLQETLGDPTGIFATITPLAVSTGLAAPDAANAAIVVVETVNVRWQDSGRDPTAAVGMLAPAGSILKVTGGASLHGFRAISTGAAASLSVLFYT